ncbi:MAG: sigma-E processing peptidase SpoIIGA [Lachnospiraceae bacterium]|nr:sigma-E processing peptidase SpoIIGA [Lachnospiraceae bacterium]
MDYMLLLLTGKILQKQKKRMGIVFAALLGSTYTVIYYVALPVMMTDGSGWFQLLLQTGNPAVAYAMVRSAFGDKSGKQNIASVTILLAFAYVTGGVLAWAEETFVYFRQYRSSLWMSVGALLFGYLFLRNWTESIRERLFRKKCHLPVLITLGEKQVRCCGLMDSGNSLYEPITRRPVVIVEKQLFINNNISLPDVFFAIPYHAIGTKKGILKGVLADELEIPAQQGEQRWQKVMLGIYEGKISQKDEYQVILHPKL